MKKAYTFCNILIIVCAIATFVITLIKGSYVVAVVFPMLIGNIAFWSFQIAENPELFGKTFGWKWEYGKFQWGEVDYTTVPKERRKLVAAIITLFFALASLFFWIIK